MIRNALTGIEGVGLYPAITLIIFFGFFVAMLVWILKKNKAYTEHMAALPLDDNDSKKPVR